MKCLIVFVVFLVFLSSCNDKVSNCVPICKELCVKDNYVNNSGIQQYTAIAKFCNYQCENQCLEVK